MTVSSFARGLIAAAFATTTGLGLGGMGTMAGCGAGRLSYEHPITPEARAASVSSAVDDIVVSRCDREERCRNLGPEQKYGSRDACESKLQGTTASEINTNDCALGVDGRKLETCLAAIRAEDCGSVVDKLGTWNACRNGQVCYH